MVSNREIKEIIEAQGNDLLRELVDLRNQMFQKFNHIEKVLGEIEVSDLTKLTGHESTGQKENTLAYEKIVNQIRSTERKLDQLRVAQASIWHSEMENVTVNISKNDSYDFGVWGMWFSLNYGASLTSYALGRLLDKVGYSFIMIDMPALVGGDHVRRPGNRTRDFIRRNFNVTEMMEPKQAYELNEFCKAFLVGSDSVFGGGYNHQLYDLQGCVYGEKAENGKPLLAFSTSLGSWEPCNDGSLEQRFTEELLKKFIHISVREQSGVKYLKDAFDINCSWTLDPVFIVEKTEYIRIEKLLENLPEKYIFVYLLQPDERKMQLAQYIAKKKKLEVVFVPDMNQELLQEYTNYKDGYSFRYYDEIDVEQWLYALDKAEYVVTDSYHGMCFSVIYQKQFVALYPRNQIGRFRTIADNYALDKYIDIRSEQDVDAVIDVQIDYEKITPAIVEKALLDYEEFKQSIEAAEDVWNARKTGCVASDLKEVMKYKRALRELG